MARALYPDDWFRSASWVDDPSRDIDEYVDRLQDHERMGYDLAARLHEWRRDGYVVFRDIVPTDLLSRVESDVATVMAAHRQFHLPIDGDGALTAKYKFLDEIDEADLTRWHLKLVDLHKISLAASNLAMPPQAVDFLKHVFSAPPALLQTLTFSVGSEQPIHQDFPYVFQQRHLARLAAFWIPLEDIHQNSGPLTYYPGSHDLRRLGFFDWGEGAINQFDRVSNQGRFDGYESFLKSRVAELGIAPVQFLPRRGDLLVWHGALAHAGSPIIDRGLTRKSMVGHFTALDGHFELEQRHINGGYVFDRAVHKDVTFYGKRRPPEGVLTRLRRRLGMAG